MGFFEFVINNGTIAVNLEASDWKDAMRKGGAFLVTAGCCEQRYIDAMIDGCINNGPYFIIALGLAIPHSRPECSRPGTHSSLRIRTKNGSFVHAQYSHLSRPNGASTCAF